MNPSEKFEDLINELSFEILNHNIDEIGEYETLVKIIKDVFNRELSEEY